MKSPPTSYSVTQIGHISDTAKWVAVYRAMETKRPDAIFRDPFAERLAGEQGQAIVDGMKRGRAMAWAMIVRTAVFDEIILERVRNGNADVVLNLAAGLDARPWRMPLPSSLRWIDVDHSGILDHKTEIMKNEKPVCRYEAIRLDLADVGKRQALFSQIDAESSRVLVVSEGLVVYLKPDDVASLARDLHAARHFQWWVFDLASPRLLEMMQKMWGRSVNAGNAPFQFGPAESTDFFRPFGWEEREYHPAMEDAQRLNRQMKFMFLWRFLGRLRSKRTQEDFRRFSGSVLLERM
jgi:methyltransferase (TIGR00027 family)